jgi:medium-chain acyl-[acyl-carrier-protein] hydrolase
VIPGHIQICALELPGRESRLAEQPIRSLPELIQALASALEPFVGGPYALFGHSLGGLLSFELARELRRRAKPAPVRLFVSACRAPHLPNRYRPICGLNDELFIEHIARLGGIPREILGNSEVLELVIPALRADYEMYESYVHTFEPNFAFPVTALGGSQDELVTSSDLVAWCFHTSGSFRLRMLPGGHLFLRYAPTRVIHTVLEELGRIVGDSRASQAR